MTAAAAAVQLTRGTRVQFNGFGDYLAKRANDNVEPQDRQMILGEYGVVEAEVPSDEPQGIWQIRLDRGETVQAQPDEFEIIERDDVDEALADLLDDDGGSAVSS